MNLFLRLSNIVCIFYAIFFSVNLGAVEIKSPITDVSPLSVKDQEIYDESLNLINQFNGTGNQLETAYKMLVDLAKRNPNSGYPYAAFADLKYRLAGMGDGTYADAYAIAQRAVQLDPNIADAYVVIAKIMIIKPDLIAAQEAANKAIFLSPGKPEAMFAMGRVAQVSKQYDESERWYRKAIDTYNDNIRKSNIYRWLAEMLSEKVPEDIVGATEAYTKSAELSFNESPFNLSDIGYFLITKTDHFDQAIGYFEQALKIKNFDEARTGLGLAEYYKWGDATLNPNKYKNSKRKPLTPQEITAKIGVTPEFVLANNARIKNPYAAFALLKKGIVKSVDVAPNGVSTALAAAATGDNLDLVKLLVAKGANVNAASKGGSWPPIFHAVIQGNFEMVKLLVENGARLNAINESGYPVTRYALNETTGKAARILSYLLENGADPTIPDKNGSILIVHAVLENDVAAVRLLVDKYHADVNAKYYTTPILQWAAYSTSRPEKIVAYTTGRPQKLGHYAASRVQTRDFVKSKEIFSILLNAGANPWLWDGDADTYDKLVSPRYTSPQDLVIYKEIAAMLIEARRKIPRPSDFGLNTKRTR